MNILAFSVNHGTTPYMDLMIRSLLDVDQTPVQLLVLDNDADDLSRLEWQSHEESTSKQSGYGVQSGGVTTHGEILRQAIVARPEPDAYLLIDADAFFLRVGTVVTMAEELEANPRLFAVQAR